jgi:predicted ester cyclase
MTGGDLAELYRAYIACLNRRAWAELGRFVHDGVEHNERRLGLPGYRALLERDVAEIPDLRFALSLLIVEPPFLASRLAFDCTPAGTFLGLPVNGRRVAFTENVFYEFVEGRIRRVWSVIDTAAIEAQLSG